MKHMCLTSLSSLSLFFAGVLIFPASCSCWYSCSCTEDGGKIFKSLKPVISTLQEWRKNIEFESNAERKKMVTINWGHFVLSFAADKSVNNCMIELKWTKVVNHQQHFDPTIFTHNKQLISTNSSSSSLHWLHCKFHQFNSTFSVSLSYATQDNGCNEYQIIMSIKVSDQILLLLLFLICL